MHEKIDQTEENCAEVINHLVEDEPGIVQVNLHPTDHKLSIDYDPTQIDAARVDELSQAMSPLLSQRWEKCTLRLGRQGGRACESCALGLERRVGLLPGVQRVSASYMGGALSIAFDGAQTNTQDIARHITQMGVEVRPSAATEMQTAVPEMVTLPSDRRQMWEWFSHNTEAIFTIVTLVSMFAALLLSYQNVPGWLVMGLYGVAYAFGGYYGFKGGVESLRQRTIDVDLLMVLAAIGAALVGEFFEGAMLLFLFSLSNVLQDFAMDRTRNAIRALMQLRPSTARIMRGDREMELPIEDVRIGDLMVIKPGDRIALDGLVVAGESSVDQSAITGESIPVAKQNGDLIFAGAINQTGSLDVRVTKLAKDSTIARLIQMVEEARSEKAETQRFIDQAEQYYALGVIVLTALFIVIPPTLLGVPFDDAFYKAMTILVAASPCAIVISTPATVLSAIGNGARRGVLFKGGVYVENAATARVIAFDKTGTLTVGKPQVTDIHPLAEVTEDELLALATAVESKSEHPLAQATIQAANSRGLLVPVTGKGVRAEVDGRQVQIGNLRLFADQQLAGLEEAQAVVAQYQDEGKTSVVVATNDDPAAAVGRVLGVIAYADVMRPDAPQVIADLRQRGIEHFVMLTGDHERVARHIAELAGVDELYADLLPEDKVTAVKHIQEKYGPAIMVGDGVNDAPALAVADIGMAMGAAGTDVALETADIVLMGDDLKNIPYVIGLSKQTRRTLVVNLTFALSAIVVMLFFIIFRELPLPLAVLGHEGGTVLVSLNGMRLLRYRG
ncbi:MAG TPA: heavy metal translocating P-type ATPase [Chloroflexota bacterium]|nr:heavy metal translocating P-type ATPase [Chloroflexota bacterium]